MKTLAIACLSAMLLILAASWPTSAELTSAESIEYKRLLNKLCIKAP